MTTVTADTDPAEAQRVMQDRGNLDLRTATPGIVVAVSADGTTVDVQPAISMTQRLEEVKPINLPVLRGVPLAVMGSTSKGLFVVIPVSIGDEGMLVVCDRAIDNWQYGEGVNMTPDMQTPRHHDLTDATFYPGLQRASGAIPNFPTDAVQLRNRAGDCVLSLSDTVIEAKVPGGAMARMEGGAIVLTANVNIVGNLGQTGGTSSLTGNVNITGNVDTTGTLTNNGKAVGSTLRVQGVVTGVNLSGTPV